MNESMNSLHVEFKIGRYFSVKAELAADIDMSCNILKTVCMIFEDFNPTCNHKTVRFPN